MEVALIAGGVLLLVAFVCGFVLGRKSMTPTGAPTPASAQVQVDSDLASDSAAAQAEQQAKAKAAEVMHESDADIAARVERLRARGRAGE